ncbi:hypothetical protein IAT38_003697 [Cryptococcus sp. DSM 104549]
MTSSSGGRVCWAGERQENDRRTAVERQANGRRTVDKTAAVPGTTTVKNTDVAPSASGSVSALTPAAMLAKNKDAGAHGITPAHTQPPHGSTMATNNSSLPTPPPSIAPKAIGLPQVPRQTRSVTPAATPTPASVQSAGFTATPARAQDPAHQGRDISSTAGAGLASTTPSMPVVRPAGAPPALVTVASTKATPNPMAEATRTQPTSIAARSSGPAQPRSGASGPATSAPAPTGSTSEPPKQLSLAERLAIIAKESKPDVGSKPPVPAPRGVGAGSANRGNGTGAVIKLGKVVGKKPVMGGDLDAMRRRMSGAGTMTNPAPPMPAPAFIPKKDASAWSFTPPSAAFHPTPPSTLSAGDVNFSLGTAQKQPAPRTAFMKTPGTPTPSGAGFHPTQPMVNTPTLRAGPKVGIVGQGAYSATNGKNFGVGVGGSSTAGKVNVPAGQAGTSGTTRGLQPFATPATSRNREAAATASFLSRLGLGTPSTPAVSLTTGVPPTPTSLKHFLAPAPTPAQNQKAHLSLADRVMGTGEQVRRAAARLGLENGAGGATWMSGLAVPKKEGPAGRRW